MLCCRLRIWWRRRRHRLRADRSGYVTPTNHGEPKQHALQLVLTQKSATRDKLCILHLFAGVYRAKKQTSQPRGQLHFSATRHLVCMVYLGGACYDISHKMTHTPRDGFHKMISLPNMGGGGSGHTQQRRKWLEDLEIYGLHISTLSWETRVAQR